MRNRTFVAFLIVLLCLGFVVGYRFSRISKLDTAKLLNIVGLYYALLGILVLNEILAPNAKWKRVSVELIAPATLWAHTAIPIGAAVGAAVAFSAHWPSASIVFKFAVGFFACSLIPLAFLDVTVVKPQFGIFKATESRWRFFGFLLVLSGVALQLVAAVVGFKVP